MCPKRLQSFAGSGHGQTQPDGGSLGRARIRSYHPTDKPALLELLRLNTPAFFAPAEEADFIHYLSHEAAYYFVMEEAGQLLGCGGYNLLAEGTRAHISWDIFGPESQGKGLGTALTKFRISEIKQHPEVQTIVVRTTPQVCRFYEKSGFRTIKTVENYWAPGYDLVHMEMPAR